MSGTQDIAPGAALSAFSGASQHNRIMRLEFPFQDGPQVATLLANKLRAIEAVSKDFRADVEILSDDPRIPLKMMMGRMVTISLVREDGSLRYFNGYVTEFRFVRTDGGFAFYHMVLEPWMAFTRLRKNCVSFHGKSVREITEETLKHYRQADWRMLVEEDPRLTVANQYNESDHNHLHRRWEALGLYYWYEHSFDGHRLILSDLSVLAESIDATSHYDPDVIPFRDKAGSTEADGIREWTAVRRLGSGKTTIESFDYKNPVVQRAEYPSANNQGDVFAYEVYEDAGGYGFRLREEGEKLAQRRMVEQDKNTQYFEAAGNARTIQPGRSFKLGGHFSAEPRRAEYDPEPRRSIDDRNYLILAVEHEVTNNYLTGQGAPSHYENRFTCTRQDIYWRPGLHYNSQPCPDPGIQTATVVGPAGAEIHTDGSGRVKLQFHWDRLGNYDENSSPWIRVLAPGAGNEFGHIRLPRVGDEVAVVCANGNIDHPLIIGSLYNATHMPPWKLPSQAALAGLRSHEMGGHSGRGNHLVLDDTSGKIQVQLKSDHQCSQLSLGHITRIEDTAGRKDARGEGWELRTDGHGVARAAKGLLITTEARQHAQGAVKDMGETTRHLDTAHALHDAQATAALQGLAQETGQQHDVADALKTQNEELRGAGEQFPELSQPHVVVTSPAGIETSSAQSTHIASAEHTALTTGRSLSIAAGDSLFASIKQTFRLFVHKAGMKLVTAAGKITMQAHDDDIQIIANKVLSLISQSDWIDLKGKKGIRLHGSECMVEITDRMEVFAPKSALFHGNLETLAPQNRPNTLAEHKIEIKEQKTPQDPKQLVLTLQTHPENGRPFANVPYTLYKDGSQIDEGITDDLGRIAIEHTNAGQGYTVELANGEKFELKTWDKFDPKNKALHREQTLSNQGLRALDGSTDGRLYS